MRKIYCLILLSIIGSSASQAQLSTKIIPVVNQPYVTGLTAVKDKDNFLILTGYQQNHQLMRTTNGGQQFSPMSFPATFYPFKFHVLNDTVIAIGNGVYMSPDFGDTWIVQSSAVAGETYEEMAIMPDRKVWMVGYSANAVRLYETDLNFSSYTLKYELPFPRRIFKLSNVSSDIVYFCSRDLNGVLWLYKTINNGMNWTPSDILEPFDNNSCRISHIEYHNSTQATVFGYDFGSINKDYYTTDGFEHITFDSLCAIAHVANEVVDWVNCGNHNYLIYTANENSQSGIQEVVLNADGTSTLGHYEPFAWSVFGTISHRNDVMTIANIDTTMQLVQGFCKTNNVGEVSASATDIFPNPTTGHVEIKTSSSIIRWDLFDVTGRKVMDGSRTSLDVSVLPPGLYVLRLTGKNNVVSTHKLLKE